MRLSAAIGSLIIVVPAIAQTGVPAAATAAPAVTRPALISNVDVAPGDSNLVRAAKLSVAARLRSGTSSAFVINNHTLMRAYGSTGGVPAGPSGRSAPGETIAPVDPASNRAALMKQRDTLTRDLQHARVESDEVYGDNIDEDLAAKRMSEIPKQLEKIDKKLNPPQPHE